MLVVSCELLVVTCRIRALVILLSLGAVLPLAGSSQYTDSAGRLRIALVKQPIGGITPAQQRDPNSPPPWLAFFEAARCREATDRAKFLGATPYVENMEISEEGHVSVMADPQGAAFGIHSKKR